jgi:hypothetical protein
VGAARPEVLGWSTIDGPRTTDTCVVSGPSEVELVVLPVPDTITDISVTGAHHDEVVAS